MKVDRVFVKNSIELDREHYSEATVKVGLWDSEKYAFTKYLKTDDWILDIGCGTGRTTLALYDIGYKNITGLDLSSKMLDGARALNSEAGRRIDFIEGDATDLKFSHDTFSSAIFSFNGFMQIPTSELRLKALKEIRRVLVDGGYFIFTTHDRYLEEEFSQFWKDQEQLWREGRQDERLIEFGDVIAPSATTGRREIFIHIPTKDEVVDLLQRSGLKLIETFYRRDLFTESEEVRLFSGECRFFIVQKQCR